MVPLPHTSRQPGSRLWHVVEFILKAACPSATVPVYNPRLEREEYECSTWRTKALSYIYNIRPSIVLVSDSSGYVKLPSSEDPGLPSSRSRNGGMELVQPCGA